MAVMVKIQKTLAKKRFIGFSFSSSGTRARIVSLTQQTHHGRTSRVRKDGRSSPKTSVANPCADLAGLIVCERPKKLEMTANCESQVRSPALRCCRRTFRRESQACPAWPEAGWTSWCLWDSECGVHP